MNIKKLFLIFVLFCSVLGVGVAQEVSRPKLYNESEDGMKVIEDAIAQAQEEKKYLFCQVGGNWCPWCIRFAEFIAQDSTLKALMDSNFIYLHINWSRNNKNPKAMQFLGNPARFGFPVFVIVNDQGKPIHIQNSAYLEENKGYSMQKVKEFLQNWTPEAVTTLRE